MEGQLSRLREGENRAKEEQVAMEQENAEIKNRLEVMQKRLETNASSGEARSDKLYKELEERAKKAEQEAKDAKALLKQTLDRVGEHEEGVDRGVKATHTSDDSMRQLEERFQEKQRSLEMELRVTQTQLQETQQNLSEKEIALSSATLSSEELKEQLRVMREQMQKQQAEFELRLDEERGQRLEAEAKRALLEDQLKCLQDSISAPRQPDNRPPAESSEEASHSLHNGTRSVVEGGGRLPNLPRVEELECELDEDEEQPLSDDLDAYELNEAAIRGGFQSPPASPCGGSPHLDHDPLCPPSPPEGGLSIQITTWNVNGKAPCESFQGILAASTTPPDIYAVGLQEMVDVNPGTVMIHDAKATSAWEYHILQELAEKYGPEAYAKLHSAHLVGTAVCIFIRADWLAEVKNIESSTVGCGLLKTMGNKGGVAVRFEVREHTLVLISSHLNAGQEKTVRRHQDFREIASRLALGKYPLISHDITLWFGDLNYRLDLPVDHLHKLFNSGAMDSAEECKRLWFQADQLLLAKAEKKAFEGFEEGAITFWPTYKYKNGTSNYDPKRGPAWTDRVMWKTQERQMRCLFYGRHELMVSDHKPVTAVFQVGPRPGFVPQARRNSLPAALGIGVDEAVAAAGDRHEGGASESVGVGNGVGHKGIASLEGKSSSEISSAGQRARDDRRQRPSTHRRSSSMLY